jgi:oligopeptide/dipeptide ABC transporter ATP-binding protein
VDPMVELGVAATRRQAMQTLRDLFGLVELMPAEQFWNKYPHQLSGGQRQRVILARALSMSPALIVADEPVSMIDVSLRLSVLGLMARVNAERDIAFLYITHDLSTAHYIAHRGRLVVMYLGRIVETGPLGALLARPRHPYLHALLAAVPVPDPHVAKAKRPLPLKSLDMADLSAVPTGCAFHPRCPHADAVCAATVPGLRMVGDSLVACHHAEEIAWKPTVEARI